MAQIVLKAHVTIMLTMGFNNKKRKIIGTENNGFL